MAKRTIEDKILDYMKQGNTINQWDAIELFRYTRLSATIFNLKERGIDIKSKWVKSNITGKKYKDYWISEEKVEQETLGFNIEKSYEWPD